MSVEVSQSKAEKRLIRKEAQKSRKVARKHAEQTSNFSQVLSIFHSPAHIRSKYSVAVGYNELPCDPEAPEDFMRELSRIISRPPKYHAKYAAQEIALLRLALPFLIGGAVGVLDIGAGNANLACLIHMLFKVPVLCVDRDPPPTALAGETRLPSHQVTRLEADIGELDLRIVDEWREKNSLSRGVLVLAKHLCGLGTDLAIDFVARMREREEKSVCGMIAVTCCCNKILGSDAIKYRELYCSSFPSCSSGISSSLVSSPPSSSPSCCFSFAPPSSSSSASCSSFSSSSSSSSSPPSSASSQPGDNLIDLFSFEKIETMARCSGYRNNAQSHYARASAEMVELAEAFEDAFQSPRQHKLTQLFGRCDERKYVPSSFSLQNRVLVAGENNFTCNCKLANTCNCATELLLRLMRKRIQEESSWPLDFRPQGFGSAKFDYDGT